jgi:hypothetical protein
MHNIFRKQKGPRIEEIEKIIRIKNTKEYKNGDFKSFRKFIRQFTDYAPSTVYTYIKLYQVFGDELQNLGFSKARLLLKYNKVDDIWISRAKELKIKELEDLLKRGNL